MLNWVVMKIESKVSPTAKTKQAVLERQEKNSHSNQFAVHRKRHLNKIEKVISESNTFKQTSNEL